MVIVAGFIFGGQGLEPRTLVAWMLDTGWGLAFGSATWWLFAGRGYRAALSDPTVNWLRAFALSRAAWFFALAPWALVLEAPWLTLWAIGTQDWRFGIAVLTSGLGLVAHAQVVSHRPRTRRRLPRVAWLELSGTLGRVLWRRFPLAFVVLGAGWTLATALCLVMGERAVEAVATRLEFIVTTLGLAALISAASLRWLLHDELRRLRWLLDSSRAHVAQTSIAEIVAAAGQTIFALGVSLLVLGLRLPELAYELPGGLLPSIGVALLATTLVPVLAQGREPSRAPLRAVLAVAPYLFVASLTASPLLHAGVLTVTAALAVVYRARFVDARPVSPERAR